MRSSPVPNRDSYGPLEPERPDGPFASRLQKVVRLASPSEVSGFVYDPDDPERQFIVELLINSSPVAVARAHVFDLEAVERNFGDGCYGFAFAVPAVQLEAATISIVLANSDFLVGNVVLSRESASEPASTTLLGQVSWAGGLRLRGCLAASEITSRVFAFVDGECVAEGFADRWAPKWEGETLRVEKGFDLFLPLRFADGRLRRAHVRGEDGRALAGSPCAFVAYEDGLARFLERCSGIESETLRGELYDRLHPQSLPFDCFQEWLARFPRPVAQEGAVAKVCVVLTGRKEVETSVESLQLQSGRDWMAISVADCADETAIQPEALLKVLKSDGERFEFVAFVGSGTLFEPNALDALAQALTLMPRSPLAYCDLVARSVDGELWPLAFSAFDQERMLEQGYAALFFLARREPVMAALEEGADDVYRVFLHCLRGRRTRAGDLSSAPVHVPGCLAEASLDSAGSLERLARAAQEHCQAIGLDASVTPRATTLLPAVRVRRLSPAPAISIIVQGRGGADEINSCLEMIARASKAFDAEILLVMDALCPIDVESTARCCARDHRIWREPS